MTPIEKLSTLNFLSVCDVAMDIKEELQMTKGNSVQIPVLRSIIRPAPFNQLLPADSANLRDIYGDYRIKALEYLKTNNDILSFKIIDSHMHRWEDQIEVSIERKDFDKFYEHLTDVYQKRVVEPNKKEEAKKKKEKEPAESENKTSTDYVIEVMNFFKDEYNKLKISGLSYEYCIGESMERHNGDPSDKETEEYDYRVDAIRQLHKVRFITTYRIVTKYHGAHEIEFAICKIDESKMIQPNEAPPATEAGVESVVKKVVHEHVHRFENSAQEKAIILNHKHEDNKPNMTYITQKGDDFYYKGKYLKLSKNAEYYSVFCSLYAKLPDGGEVSYKELNTEIQSRLPKTKSKTDEEMRKFIQSNLTDTSNGFVRYAKIPQSEDNGKPLIEIMRGSGVRFNNKRG